MRARKQFDVLGLGCAAVDDILYVDEYPPADAKVHVRRRERHCGGLTATALVAAARLGAKCAFAGTLGFDEDSEFVIETLRRERMNVDHVVRRRDAGPVISTIIVDEQRGTRNIFASIEQSRGADPKRPSRAVIESTRVLFVDYFGVEGNLRAAKVARAAGVAIVSDLERTKLTGMNELIALIDHPIFSRRAAAELTGTENPAKAVVDLWNDARDTVVVTCGEQGAWFVSRDQRQPKHVSAFKVKAIDTTGCGDVFHGAYAAALAQGMDAEQRIRFASATAALKATRHGGQSGIPSRAEVQKFLRAAT
ncbi:MAG TPA: PfkB family carbohydrate kinase [Candidatus Acidoferrum sp.]|nr:PfkB family carbohydrate kinase [Candidatus Acidoferrum sp.]